MFRLRGLYVFSLVILGVLLVAAVFRPLVTGREYNAVARESVLQQEGHWIIQFDIVNLEEKETTYNLTWSSGDVVYNEDVLVGSGRIYTHIRHVYPENVVGEVVNLTIFKEGEDAPFEELTYYLK